MRKIFSVITIVVMLLMVTLSCSCIETTEADKVNYNLTKEADYFNCERKITVYNARTDNEILSIEGYLSLSNNLSNELVITCKTGENEYKKNYVYLTENVLYVVEDITGTHTDPYHYKLTWHTTLIPIEVEVQP